ncbi:collagen-like protein [Paenibacillus sp. ACRRY]|uniref:collagen-like protein n=1 Tax=Paenibacillus sp. ACRRY TaxID=2918208 RepID=UPI001EF554FD|nr:collagen-like protein [Paenibacillus sp. ACRRY]MCG7381897.1 collagen-like protein [Paenibacillus sp. ACRRY]
MTFLPPFGPGGGFGGPGGPGGPGGIFGPGGPGGPGGPSGPPPFTGGGGGGPQGVQPPPGPPPSFVPQQSPSLFAVDPRAISGCLFRYTYIWPNRGPGFWMYPVFVGRNSVAGFRWTGFFWVYSGIDLQRISSFSCF